MTTLRHLIPATAIDRYSGAPPSTKVAAAKSVQESIRNVLGNSYETFLQGSYKNDTGVADINDVDIVALRKGTTSTYFTGTTATYPITWEEIFAEVRTRLEASHYYRGKTDPGDKCITVNTTFKADVVPAIHIGGDDDPIAVYSFRERKERLNYPRVHYRRDVEKQARTHDTYKPTVRMFKRWARNWFTDKKAAPSFYVECLVHSVPDDRFLPDRAYCFFSVADYIVQEVSTNSVVYSVAGDKDILVPGEWEPVEYQQFRATLDTVLGRLATALRATSSGTAQDYWRGAFNE